MPASPAASTMAEITELIRFDTTSRESNRALVDRTVALLRAVGVEPVLVPNAAGTKANLLATFPAVDGTTEGGIVLSAHTDVVPVDGQAWSSEPFAPEVRDGRLYGRGSADMKSFLGVVLAKLPELVAAPLAEPIHLALSYDEEVGCVGAVDLVAEIVRQDLRPRGCVVGEPSSMRIVRGHKSMNVFRADFHGVAAHSSLPTQGVNAIAHAAELVRFVHAVADEMRADGPFDDGYVVPYTTVTANRIEGGIAINTIPADCSVHFEFRGLTSVDHAALGDRFRAGRRHARRRRDRRARGGVGRASDRREGHVRHRGRPLRRGGHPDRRVRPGRHRPGPRPRRVHRARADRPVRGVRRPAHRRAADDARVSTAARATPAPETEEIA